MTIDQIKQAMKYAEDYKWIDENLNILKPDCQRIPWEYLGTSPYYGFFLQRVIEGINRVHKDYRLRMNDHNDIRIFSRHPFHALHETCEEEPDQAKEQAIIWVLENEL